MAFLNTGVELINKDARIPILALPVALFDVIVEGLLMKH